MYIVQLISSINFKLAQSLGIQEDPDYTDSLIQRSELYVAYWDLLTLIWMPVSGALMILGSESWPYFSLVAGAIYFDVAGREAVKNLSFRHEGLRVGARAQQKVYFASYIAMGCLGVLVAFYALSYLA
ncbi:hypothetical protein GCM10009104_02710 [Marinobacterium maritimum]|uniref:Uncharacterized protein n=1 Tax=Marinobacterium maritimum TaxID=500162 RepID=A0ABN1I2J8_9GAMM